MIGLFDNDPVFKEQKRDSKGRFATAERAMYDKALKENNYLRYKAERYRRIAEVPTSTFIAQQRIIAEQSRVIADLRRNLKELAQTKNISKC